MKLIVVVGSFSSNKTKPCSNSYKIVLCFKAPVPSMMNEGKLSSLEIQINNNILSKIDD